VAKIIENNEDIFAQYFINGEPNKIGLKFYNPDFLITIDKDRIAIVGVAID
jgi:hypothetical protein